MNEAKIYVPFSILFFSCIVYLSLSVPTFNLIIHFIRFIFLSAFLGILLAGLVYFLCKNRFDSENLFSLTVLSAPIGFIVILSLFIFINGYYTTNSCYSSSYEVVDYVGRYASGLGNIEKKKIEANQWILTIRKNDKNERFVLDIDISTEDRVTKTMDLEFCKGLLGTEYLNLRQIPE